MNGVRSILALFTPRERRRGMLVLMAAVVMAVVDTAGVASILPFLAVLGNPDIIETNAALATMYRLGGFTGRDEFLFALGFIALAIVLSAAIIRAVGQYAILRFANMRRYSISRRMLDSYLAQPYAFFLDRNSADLTKRALSDVDLVVDNCLVPIIQMVAHGLVIVMLVVLIVAVDPFLATIVLAVVCGFYGIIMLASRQLLGRIGTDRSLANRERFTVVGEAFGGIKEVKLFGRERSFAQRFSSPALRFARHKATADVISMLPRYLLDALAFGGALALVLALIGTGGNIGAVLPILGLYAFAGYRLMPAVQHVYSGLTRLRFNLPVVHAILADLPLTERDTAPDVAEPLSLKRSIRFENVTYRYREAARPTLVDLDLEIEAGSTLGIIGPTGSGKTTVIDLLLGLLDPVSGRILVDGAPLGDANRRAWQAAVGYVPQSIFLADASIAENIAFGIAPDEIDRKAVERAARVANIHEFVISELPDGYDTQTGERGVRLSGGQRQRIGIARALYRDPAVLVFDEATSALDNATEAAVMEAIGRLHGEKTIVLVAHRLTTVEGCDQVLLMKNDRLVPVDKGRDLAHRTRTEELASLSSALCERNT